MQKLILVQGLPFSGKSKLTRWMAKELGYARLAADDYRKMLFDKRAPIPDDEERLVGGLLGTQRDILLSTRRNVVWESAAWYNNLRARISEYDPSMGL